MAKKGTLFGKPREEVVTRPGAFTAKAAKAGKSTGAYAKQVLKPTSKASTQTKRQANLAKTFAKLRAGKTKFLVPLVLAALLGPAAAATKSCDGSTLTPTALTATGPTPDIILARAVPALIVQAVRTAGTATLALEVSCDDLTWAPVGNGTMSVSATVPSAVASVMAPACSYRVNVTACASCSVKVLYACAGAH
jgi:hypothetical protein